MRAHPLFTTVQPAEPELEHGSAGLDRGFKAPPPRAGIAPEIRRISIDLSSRSTSPRVHISVLKNILCKSRWPSSKPLAVWTGRASLLFNIAAVVPIVVTMLLVQLQAAALTLDVANENGPGQVNLETPARHAQLLLEHQTGFAPEPLPLGISLSGASGNETLTIAGFPSGFELSLGTFSASRDWQVSANDLEQTWVSAPEDFVGLMNTVVNLHAASGELLESKTLQFEWIPRRQEASTQDLEPEHAPERQTAADESEILSHRVPNAVTDRSDIAADAPPLLDQPTVQTRPIDLPALQSRVPELVRSAGKIQMKKRERRWLRSVGVTPGSQRPNAKLAGGLKRREGFARARRSRSGPAPSWTPSGVPWFGWDW